MVGADMTSAVSGQGSTETGPGTLPSMPPARANLFADITRKNIPDGGGTEGTMTHRHLAIILDGPGHVGADHQLEIRNQGQISGSFTQKEVEIWSIFSGPGRLPATLKPQPVSESTMGRDPWQDTIHAGVRAVLLAFAAVLAFMIVYYRFAGLVASVALLANLILTVGSWSLSRPLSPCLAWRGWCSCWHGGSMRSAYL